MKVCTKCNQEKPFEEFPKRKNSKDGYRKCCKACKNAEARSWRKDNLEERRAYGRAMNRKWREENPEKVKEYSRTANIKHRAKKTEAYRTWKHNNPEKAKAARDRNNHLSIAWAKAHPDKVKEYDKKWRERNPDKVNANCSMRRARLVNATPTWLTKEHKKQMSDFYKSAKTAEAFHEVKFHVDHIEPLKGENEKGEHVSCGLHVPWNLQVLTESDNCKKSNKVINLKLN